MNKTKGSLSLDVTSRYSDGYDTDEIRPKTVTLPAPTYEFMSDEKPGFDRYGNCHHRKESFNQDRSPIHGENTAGIWWTWHDRGWFYDRVNWSPSLTGFDVSQLNGEAYLTMKPSLSSGFSLSNFLVELAEFKLMFRLWRKANTVLSNIGSGYLNYQFGWKLFIQDLMELYDKLSNMEKTLHDYKSKQGRVLVRHFRKKFDTERITIDSLNYLGGEQVIAKRDKVFHATMRYTYVVPNIESEYADVKGMLDLLGLKLNASVIWEAIPFSFVVDWFVNVGDFLASRYDQDFLDSVVTILDYCYSTKTVDVISGKIFMDRPDIVAPSYLGTITRTEYIRRRAIPDSADFGLALSGRYGKKQILLSAALLVA